MGYEDLAMASAAFADDYQAKPTGYCANARRDWVDPSLRDPTLRVVELGCGSGASGALALASLPNIGHWRIIAGLVVGRFDYQAEGVMDRTHLRWFTPRSLKRTFEGAGLTDVRVSPLGWTRRNRSLSRVVPLRHLMWR